MDRISGVRASKKDITYASKYRIGGIFRPFFILLLPAGGHLVDMIIGAPGPWYCIRAAVIRDALSHHPIDDR
ncbi:phage holin family protein [Domibacillus antri]|nr:phage holin family protein [Domibacillus antri]